MSPLSIRIPLPVLSDDPQRPRFARGPRSINAVKMLRISVTDRCNLRCGYCMPEGGVRFAPKAQLLSADEIEAIARVARGIGVTHIKITGGEPTVRRDVVELVGRVVALGFQDVSMTTNATQLERLALPLRAAGLDRLTVSLDTLDTARYSDITAGGSLERALAGIDAAERAGFEISATASQTRPVFGTAAADTNATRNEYIIGLKRSS